MKRILTLLFLVGALVSCGTTEPKQEKLPMVIAHRGCWLDDVVPENSIAAVGMAKRYGYAGIECDVRYTKDSVMVILHDGKLNRTTRLAKDYSKLEKEVHLRDLTFEEVRRDYVLASSDPALRTPIPTLEELLADAKKPSGEIVSNLKILMISSRNREKTMFLEQKINKWKIFFDIMKNYVIINNNVEIHS